MAGFGRGWPCRETGEEMRRKIEEEVKDFVEKPENQEKNNKK